MLNTNEARIETSTVCNYSCVFCPHSTSHFTRKKEVMSLYTFIKILKKLQKEAPQITDITISGFGEAFLDETIIDKIKYARRCGYNVHILTNGSLLTYSIIDELIKLKVNDLRISLHSLNNKNYKKITRHKQDNFILNDLLGNIRYIYRYNSDMKLILTFDIISNINGNELYQIKKELNHVGLIEVWKPHNWVNVFKYRKGKIVKNTCNRPLNSPLQIQVDGTINMCCFDFDGQLLLGDFLNQSLAEIFNGESYLDLKQHHINGTLHQTDYICKRCDQRMNQNDVIIYNNEFNSSDRIVRTSTNYRKV